MSVIFDNIDHCLIFKVLQTSMILCFLDYLSSSLIILSQFHMDRELKQDKELEMTIELIVMMSSILLAEAAEWRRWMADCKGQRKESSNSDCRPLFDKA